MPTFKSLKEAQDFFKDDLFAYENGMTLVALGDDWAETSMEIKDRHRNAMGQVMGGAIFTLADLALAAASNNVHQYSVAQTVSISFLSATRGSKLFAKARCIKDGRTTGVYVVDVTDDLERHIAQFTGTSYKL